ncbi:MAG: hypothetical protein JNK82_15630 [Myxococcaceae bacterium]|nr:hypothetical protein [Myxococcaceae bacterium]
MLGIGLYLPAEVRTNDWWPTHVVADWEAKRRENLTRATVEAEDPPTDGVRLTREAMKAFRDDIFTGARERRVMGQGEKASDMECAAATDALQRAGVKPSEIDLLLVYSPLPDFLIVPQAPLLHARLGLKAECLSMDTNNGCNAFMHQLELAQCYIASGVAKKALIIQSSTVAHFCRPQDHHSIWFGDGASAAVIGQVSDDRGLLASAHMTDGSFHKALMGGSPGKVWYQASDLHLYNEDRTCARNMLLLISDLAKQILHAGLAKASLSPAEVDFYATHQSTYWFREVTQKYAGLTNARTFDTFAWTGSLSSCNVPFMLGMGEREGLLRPGDLVAAYSGGSGITYSSAIMRWGA